MEKIHASKLLAGLVPAGKLTSDPEVELVTTDSREVKPGCIFVAFPGERFDGHDFAARALEQGAAYVVVNHPVPGVPEEKAILCPDSYHAMMVMGANYRSQYHPKVVGVTGSVGKTTTKEMLAAVLGAALWVQIVLFFVVSIAALAATRPLVQRMLRRDETPTNADRVLGQTARVTETIDNTVPTGAVYADGKTWTARSASGRVIPKDTMVKVQRMEGVRLFVEEEAGQPVHS